MIETKSSVKKAIKTVPPYGKMKGMNAERVFVNVGKSFFVSIALSLKAECPNSQSKAYQTKTENGLSFHGTQIDFRGIPRKPEEAPRFVSSYITTLTCPIGTLHESADVFPGPHPIPTEPVHQWRETATGSERVRMAQTILIPLARENLPQVNHLTANSHQQLITEDVSLLLLQHHQHTKPPQSKTHHTLKMKISSLSAILASDATR
ncbi:hypothetical protein CDAR_473971 [Caerostris darwini]|uniref:Uncharacterized protein n=1 Tax=Caerostris darwini TaxID=1538125 RepID=A0AAV4SP72_9ARAC|nr:hypothetical protein CDAR_473881 [Caerostris darwini]GIY33438.1 hypothetical protein CDAR_473971 [Caerostris darwini]